MSATELKSENSAMLPLRNESNAAEPINNNDITTRIPQKREKSNKRSLKLLPKNCYRRTKI